MDWPILCVFLLSAAAAGPLNAAVYGWAWNSRRVSPWQATPDGVRPRGWLDRIPILGWLRLRRDASTLGRGFWIRPLMVEITFATAIAALWWWEVNRLGLIRPQLEGVSFDPAPLYTAAIAGFALHAVLAWLMLVGSLIDVDEKTIPDEVTVPGTLLGLILAALLPMGLPPNAEDRLGAPEAGIAIQTPEGAAAIGPFGQPLWLEPTHIAAPNAWPNELRGGGQNRWSLLVGLGCFGLWCFALTTRIWRGRRGLFAALGLLLSRVARDLRTRPLREILIGGVLATSAVWFTGGAAWQGLLTALAGMAVSGSIVWAVRLIGSAALGKEAMGFGDVTLMMMIGAFLGWQAGLMTFFLAPFAGLLVGIVQLLLRRGGVIPYGPFLCLGAALVVVRWGDLWRGAESLFAMGAIVPVVIIVCLLLLGVLLAVWRWFKTRVLGVSEA